MERINVSFYDETIEKLKTRMKSNNAKSLAQGVRELVDLGFRTEEAMQKNEGSKDKNDLEILSELLKKNLLWALESRLLSRYLVENLPGSSKEKQIEILEKYKQSSIDYIQGLCDAKDK